MSSGNNNKNGMLSYEPLFRVEEMFFNFVLKEICMTHVLCKYPGN